MPVARASHGSFKQPEAGPHPAICFATVSVGTQKRIYQGVEKEPWEHVRLGFELCGEDDKNDDGTRMTIWSKEMMNELGEKTNLRKLLEGWRGRAFTEQELDGFDLIKVLGKPCQVTVILKDGEGGKKFANIVSVSSLMKGYAVPEEGRKPFNYEIADGPSDNFKSLPQFIQKRIFESSEAIGGHRAWPGAGGKSSEQREQANNQSGGATDFGGDSGDEVPF